jgi:antitoxin (DNA-binding transcriptional repressor) of toxin-antitoxin stability system
MARSGVVRQADAMHRLTALGATGRFPEILDAVADRGERKVVLRRGRAVARIQPVASARGADVKDVLRSHATDREWAGELRALRSLLTTADR